jgi:hypothetical protein
MSRPPPTPVPSGGRVREPRTRGDRIVEAAVAVLVFGVFLPVAAALVLAGILRASGCW